MTFNFFLKADRVRALRAGIPGDVIEAVHCIKTGSNPNQSVLRRFEGAVA